MKAEKQCSLAMICSQNWGGLPLLGDGHEFVNPLIGLEIPILIYSMD